MIKVDERFISFDGRSPSAAGGRVRWVRLVSLPLPQQALPWWVRGFDYDPVDYDPGDLRATDDHAKRKSSRSSRSTGQGTQRHTQLRYPYAGRKPVSVLFYLMMLPSI